MPPDVPQLSLSLMERLGVILIALSAVGGTWALGSIAATHIERWRERFLEEAEVQMDEMLLMLPPTTVLNYNLIAAGVAALVAFLFFGAVGGGFSWKLGLLFALLAFAGVVSLGRLFLRFLRQRRLQRFNDQLEEALMTMSNSLKAGFSIVQAIEMVIRQGNQPISLEFRLMMQQTHLGMSIEEALRNMAERVQSEDFELVASSIITARITGGDLTGVFDRLATMIRERQRIQRRIRTLTAQGRLQAIVVSSLPLLMLVILFMLDPALVRGFFTQAIGVVMFLGVVALTIGGFLVIRKIINIDI